MSAESIHCRYCFGYPSEHCRFLLRDSLATISWICFAALAVGQILMARPAVDLSMLTAAIVATLSVLGIATVCLLLSGAPLGLALAALAFSVASRTDGTAVAIPVWLALAGVCFAVALANIRRGFGSTTVPFFSIPVPDIATLTRGRALAKNVQLLDKLAGSRQLTPISTFGLCGPGLSDAPRWYSPADALPTLTFLLQHARDNQMPTDLQLDLSENIAALNKAANLSAEFCFVLVPKGRASAIAQRAHGIGYFGATDDPGYPAA